MQVEVRPLRPADVDAADLVLRRAFGAMLGADSQGDADVVASRTGSGHIVALGAFARDALVGSAFATRWGRVGVLGPLSVDPEHWGRGIGRRLLAAVEQTMDEWRVAHRGLFTFAHSPRHHALYQGFGYWPRFLTGLLSRAVVPPGPFPAGRPGPGAAQPAAPGERGWTLMSELADRSMAVAGCERLTEQLYPGLRLTGEIDSVLDQKLGDVLLIGPEARSGAPAGFAVVHDGPGSEAGTGVAYVKFGMVCSAGAFGELIDDCLGHARQVGAGKLVLGVNTARHQAYRMLAGRGFRTDVVGVTMHAPNEPGYDREDAFVVDDWR